MAARTIFRFFLRKAVHSDFTICCPCQEAQGLLTAGTHLDLEERNGTTAPNAPSVGDSQNKPRQMMVRELGSVDKRDSRQCLCVEIPSAVPPLEGGPVVTCKS